MAMNCCHKEYAEVCEILVCVNTPAPLHLGLYQRLRFGLLASSWLPSPLGIFLWSALHVMLLIVGGPAIWVLGLLTLFLFTSGWLFCVGVLISVPYYGVIILIAAAVDLIRLLVRLIRFCWSLVSFRVGHEPIVEWKGGDWYIVKSWDDLMTVVSSLFWAFVPIGVPCMSGSSYKETKNRKLKTWAWWCEEVVHKHDTIAL